MTAAVIQVATIVDWQALLETCVAALVAGVGVALTFSLAILGTTRFAELSREHHNVQAMLYGGLALFGFVATAAAITFGIIVMTG